MVLNVPATVSVGSDPPHSLARLTSHDWKTSALDQEHSCLLPASCEHGCQESGKGGSRCILTWQDFERSTVLFLSFSIPKH